MIFRLLKYKEIIEAEISFFSKLKKNIILYFLKEKKKQNLILLIIIIFYYHSLQLIIKYYPSKMILLSIDIVRDSIQFFSVLKHLHNKHSSIMALDRNAFSIGTLFPVLCISLFISMAHY